MYISVKHFISRYPDKGKNRIRISVLHSVISILRESNAHGLYMTAQVRPEP